MSGGGGGCKFIVIALSRAQLGNSGANNKSIYTPSSSSRQTGHSILARTPQKQKQLGSHTIPPTVFHSARVLMTTYTQNNREKEDKKGERKERKKGERKKGREREKKEEVPSTPV